MGLHVAGDPVRSDPTLTKPTFNGSSSGVTMVQDPIAGSAILCSQVGLRCCSPAPDLEAQHIDRHAFRPLSQGLESNAQILPALMRELDWCPFLGKQINHLQAAKLAKHSWHSARTCWQHVT